MQKASNIITKMNKKALPALPYADEKETKPKKPARLDDLQVTSPKLADTVKTVREWGKLKRNGQNKSMVFVSVPTSDKNCTGYGCGKTHIAKAMMWSKSFVVDGVPVAPMGVFFKAHDIIELLGQGERMSALCKSDVPVLVIDDVGAEGTLRYISKEAQQEELNARYYQIIDYCYNQDVSLCLTANQTIQQLKNHIGGRAWSRLMAMCPKGFIRDLTGVPDYRLIQGNRITRR